MTPAPVQQSPLFDTISPLTRILNRHRPLHALLEAAKEAGALPLEFLSSPSDEDAQYDYAQIDPALVVSPPLDAHSSDSPKAPRQGLSYAGFTPQQRHLFLEWLQQPTKPAPPAFQTLYLAHLETTLFEQATIADDMWLLLRYLHQTEEWEKSIALSRTMLLALWMEQDSTKLIEYIEGGQIHVDLLGVALGQAALLGQILTPDMLRTLMAAWRITKTPIDGEMARVRLSSLSSTLAEEPLAFALKELDEEGVAPKPWRSAHRELRVAFPQPDLRPILTPYLEEISSISAEAASRSQPSADAGDEESDEKAKWNLVLEFQQSRSEYFDFALLKARQRPGYSQIMDEDRQIVYRVTFLKHEMRHFWSLWEYVQKWNGTEVYVNGKTVEQWKIWPYSQYLR